MSSLPPTELRTPSFTLRPFQIGDGKALFDAVDSSRDFLRAYMGWVDQHVDLAASERDARAMGGYYLLESDFSLAIAHGGMILGGTGFHLRGATAAAGVADIGMWIRKSHAGRGLGAAVLRAMLDWGFTEWPFHRLIWRCDPSNVPSRRVAEKCGLMLEGIARAELQDRSGGRADACVYAAIRQV